MKITSLSWNLVPRLIQIWRIQWWCSLFCFGRETPFFGKFGPENRNCHFKLKFGTWIDLSVQNLMPLFTFFYLRPQTPFWGQIWSKKLKLSVWAEFWYLEYVEYTEFNGVHFCCFIPETQVLVNEGKRRAIIVSATLREGAETSK